MIGSSRKLLAVAVVFVVALAAGVYFFYWQERETAPPSIEELETARKGLEDAGRAYPVTPPEAAPEVVQPVLKGDAADSGKTPIPTEDEVVPLRFVEDLAKYVTGWYQPPRSRYNAGSEGVLRVSFKKINMRYGLEPSVFNVSGQTAREARKQVLDYVFRPGFVSFLCNLYIEEFVEQVAAYGFETQCSFPITENRCEERQLSREQVQEMMYLVAKKAEDGAQVFRVLATDGEVFATLKKYLFAVRRVNDTYARYWASADESEAEKKLVTEQIKDTIVRREFLKNKAINTILREGGQIDMSGEEILYLAQWGFRRTRHVDSPQALQAVAECLHDLSVRLRAAADAL